MTSIVDHRPAAEVAMRGSMPRRLRFAAQLRAAWAVWHRELTHVLRDRLRTAIGLLQPVLFLLVLGVGLARVFEQSGAAPTFGSDYLLFLFPGILVMAVQTPSLAAGGSVVVDRHNGFLREMLVAPVRRSSLLLGKCIGGATIATGQGVVILACAGLIGVPYHPGLFALLLAEMILAALTMTALSTLAAVLIRRMQTFNIFLTVLMTPLLFVSGMMFPISALPAGLYWVSLINPLTYAVDVMRRTVIAFLGQNPSSALFEPVLWGDWHPPLLLEVAMLLVFTATLLAVASRRFSRID